eukprot:Amastigsp_a841158_233.p2 type:complete len:436 gc:universal Amastigsp_a841158_233:1352-45(-)
MAADGYVYMPGFNNHHSTEALPGALPVGQNTPQVCPYGLYAEQLSGTAFTRPRDKNRRTWFYRIRPAVAHPPFADGPKTALTSGYVKTTANQLRWSPFDLPSEPTDWVDGLARVCGAGDPAAKHGMAIYVYGANKNMGDKAFCNADGDMLIIPQLGALEIRTECGRMRVAPNEICVIQRGFRFSIDLPDGPSRGYVSEVYEGHFEIPDLGPIGANGLANPRDFETPVAWYEDRDVPFTIVQKFLDELYTCEIDHSPFDVVAWHGNYAPYKYDLSKFCVVNSVSYDHLDPCTFTVLTVQTAEVGTAACDFVIFPPRWAVQEHTFRPPYYHRNCMSEFMGLILGEYEAKKDGFKAGGASLHSCMTPHGPDTKTFEAASTATGPQTPVRIAEGTQAFMLETTYMLRLTDFGATGCHKIDENYNDVWKGLAKKFDPSRR